MTGEIPILGQRASQEPQRMIEVCRSFSYKLNLQNHGGPAYESADLFASRKMQCSEDEAAFVSQRLFDECTEEIRLAVANIKAKLRPRNTPKGGVL